MKVYLDCCISLYAFQELYSFCYGNYSADDVSSVFRLSLLKLLDYPLQIMPLLTRSDRLTYERLQEATDFITALTPEEFLAHMETST